MRPDNISLKTSVTLDLLDLEMTPLWKAEDLNNWNLDLKQDLLA